MCLGAIIWSNIKNVYYGSNRIDANNIGFRDEKIYNHLSGKEKMLELINIDREECLELLEKYNDTIY